MPTLTIGQFITQASKTLSDVGIDTSRLDVLILLEDVLDKNRALLLAHSEDELSSASLSELNKKVIQRESHAPLAYIRGRVEFYGRDYVVNDGVLVPRPESESMIDLLHTLPISSIKKVADVGTGSGCLGVTAALELKLKSVDLIDVSKKALAVAKRNAERYGIKAGLINDTFETALPKHAYDTLLANLPYVPYGYPVNQAAQHEPGIALYAAEEGLGLYRKLFELLSIKPARYVITESLLEQHHNLEQLAIGHGYKLSQTQGLAQLFIHSSF